MSRLLEQDKNQKLRECLDLTDAMEGIVREQNNINNWLSYGLFTGPKQFSTNCEAFEKFVDSVNQRKSVDRIEIMHHEGRDVNYLRTIIDSSENKVTYKLCNQF